MFPFKSFEVYPVLFSVLGTSYTHILLLRSYSISKHFDTLPLTVFGELLS